MPQAFPGRNTLPVGTANLKINRSKREDNSKVRPWRNQRETLSGKVSRIRSCTVYKFKTTAIERILSKPLEQKGKSPLPVKLNKLTTPN